MLSIEKVSDIERFAALKDEWDSVLDNSNSASITLSWKWLYTWWQVFGEDRQLSILLARNGDRLVGIAPLQERSVQYYGMISFKRLEFLASGEDEADEICSEKLDFIIRAGFEEETMRAFFQYLNGRGQHWDEMVLRNISESSPNLKFLTGEPSVSRQHSSVLEKKMRAYLSLPGDVQEFFNRQSSHLRREIRRDLKLRATKSIEMKVVENTDELDDAFSVLRRLHEARWQPRGQPGVFQSEKFSRFHREIAPELMNEGRMKMFILVVDGVPVAAQQVFLEGNRASLYQSGFDIGESGLNSPGTLLRYLAIEWAIERGFTEWDFLKAAPGSYKFRWHPSTADIFDIRLAPAGSKEMFYSTTTRMIGGLRQLRDALR